MNPTESTQCAITNTKENNTRDFLSVKDELETVIEKQFISNTGGGSDRYGANPEDTSNNLHGESDEFSVTVDEVKMLLGQPKTENVVDEENKFRMDMEVEEDSQDSVQTVEKECLKVEEEGVFPEVRENIASGTASQINVKDQLESVDYEIDKCEKAMKMESVLFEEENRESVESEEEKFQIKSETKICDSYNVDNLDNSGVGDFVKDQIGEGMYFLVLG